MASEAEPEAPELSSAFERLFRHRDLSLFLPFILGFSTSSSSSSTTTTTTPINAQDQDQESAAASPRERIILINPFTQGMVVIEGSANVDSLLRELASKNGHPPASKASIEALPSVNIGDRDGGCAICLEEWEDGVVVKEMPCKHKFHGNCIEKWLGIHGSCPVCRYKMPVDDEDLDKKRGQQEEGTDGRRVQREIWVSFSFSSNNMRNEDSNHSPSTDSDDVNSSSPNLDQETEG